VSFVSAQTDFNRQDAEIAKKASMEQSRNTESAKLRNRETDHPLIELKWPVNHLSGALNKPSGIPPKL